MADRRSSAGIGPKAGASVRLSSLTRLLLAIAAVVGAGLLSRLYPDLVVDPEPLGALNTYRLAYPVDYWNAYGALAAIGATLALGLGADPRTPVPLRALATGVTVPLAVALYLSLSRGSWLALGVGLVALVALGAHRGSLVISVALAVGGAALAIVNHTSTPLDGEADLLLRTGAGATLSALAAALGA